VGGGRIRREFVALLAILAPIELKLVLLVRRPRSIVVVDQRF
jgi:hypothetical protein